MRWGPTELIAQRPSLLPVSLAKQLLRVTSQPNKAEEAAMLLEAVQTQHAGGGNAQERAGAMEGK